MGLNHLYAFVRAVCLATTVALAAMQAGAQEGGPPGSPQGPVSDRDGDEVIDGPVSEDQCPDLAGNSFDGCPGPADVVAVVTTASGSLIIHGWKRQVVDCSVAGSPWANACNAIADRMRNSNLYFDMVGGGPYPVYRGFPVKCPNRQAYSLNSMSCEYVSLLSQESRLTAL